MNLATRRLDQLTFTRFIAALSVVFFHGGRQLGILSYLPMLTAGPTAVRYFFVLSGFVMAVAYYHPGNSFNFSTYWLARFSRIYPVYMLSFALTCLYYIDILSKIKTPEWLAGVFLYQAWIPRYALSLNIAAWSLAVEVFFYILFPFLLLLAMRRSIKEVIWFSIVFWVLSSAVHYNLTLRASSGMESGLEYFPPLHLSAFLIGLAGGIWYVTSSASLNLNQIFNRICLAVSLGLVLLLLTMREYVPDLPLVWRMDDGFIPLFLVVVLTIAFDESRFSQAFKHPWLVLLGNASYALYILHVPLRWMFGWLIELTGNKTTLDATFFVYVPVTIGVSILVYQYIERPVRDWLRKNPRMLTIILIDVILILAMIRLSFILRVGTDTSAHAHTQTLVLRVGVAVFFSALLIFRFYLTRSWRSLALAFFSGATILSGLMYFAWISGWVESFPRSILILIPLLCFAAISLSRLIMERLKPGFRQSQTV